MLLIAPSCDRTPDDASGKAASPATTPSTTSSPTVASLVPAATDLLIGMGAKDHLAAVSNWDAERDDIAGLPRVGDYRTVDFERLSLLRPNVLIAQYSVDKMPPGLAERANALQMQLVNIHVNRLEDIFTAIDQLGVAVHEPTKAKALNEATRSRLDAVQKLMASRPAGRTLLLHDAAGYEAVGGGNFLDDVLKIAGGANVLGAGENAYPTIDKEQLVSLDPEVIFQLVPGASAQVKEQAMRRWESLRELRAVRDKHVYVFDDYYFLLPSHHVADIAERFAERLDTIGYSAAKGSP